LKIGKPLGALEDVNKRWW